MRRPPRLLVAAVAVPFLVGCTATMALPVPEPGARDTVSVRGVVIGDSVAGERVEYGYTEFVTWTDTTLAIGGTLRGDRALTTRTYALDDLGAILVSELDPTRTSLLIGGVMVGIGVLGAIMFTGFTTDLTTFPSGN